MRSTEYFSSASYVDSASWLVTRRLPRTAVSPSRRPVGGEPGVVEQLLGRRLDGRQARSAGARWRRSRPSSPAARSSARGQHPGQRRRRRPAAGRSRRWPWAARSARPRPRRRATAASTPALATRLRAVPSASRSSATSRWIGSVCGVPGRRRGELGGLDGLPAAGGELLGAELAHARSLSLGSCVGPLWPSPGPNDPEVESIPLNSGVPRRRDVTSITQDATAREGTP